MTLNEFFDAGEEVTEGEMELEYKKLVGLLEDLELRRCSVASRIS